MTKDNVLTRAEAFLRQAYQELSLQDRLEERLQQVSQQIAETGTWLHTAEELTYGAKMAWRNSNRCIGRLYWKSLHVIDARQMDTPSDIFGALEKHIDFAYNGGNIKSTITVFRQRMPHEESGPRILNHQLLRFAGYENADGSITGDSAELDVTAHARKLGWASGNTSFDLLPHMIRWPGRPDEIRMPESLQRYVLPVTHPEYAWFAELGLRWYAVPIISDMLLEIGGVEYTAAPFNGWYMGTEIGSRNYGDATRYNLLPVVAQKLGLDTSRSATLWKDRALVELNRAVLHSFDLAGVTISDHHEASEQFLQFEETEQKHGRATTADWTWIVPPLSGSATPVFFKEYINEVRGPNFYYQDSLLRTAAPPTPSGCPFHAGALRGQKP